MLYEVYLITKLNEETETGTYGAIIINTKTGHTKTYSGIYEPTNNYRIQLLSILAILKDTSDIKESILIHTENKKIIYHARKKEARDGSKDLWEQYENITENRDIIFALIKNYKPEEYKYLDFCNKLAKNLLSPPEKQKDEGFIKKKKESLLIQQKMANYECSAISQEILISDELKKKYEKLTVDEHMNKYKTHDVCAANIIDFYNTESKTYESYLNLKLEKQDIWSKKKLDELTKILNPKIMDTIKKYIPNEQRQASCARWVCRGLELPDAIRKILIEDEVAKHKNDIRVRINADELNSVRINQE